MESNLIQSIMRGMGEKLVGMEKNMKLYRQHVPQGFREPCCLIEVVSVIPSRGIDNRITESVTMNATFFPGRTSGETDGLPCADEEAVRERICNAVLEMPDRLEVIPVWDGKVRGTDISCNESDGLVICTVTYPVRLMTAEEKEYMESMAWKGEWKDG